MAKVKMIADRDYKKGDMISVRVCPRCSHVAEFHENQGWCKTCMELNRGDRKKTTKSVARRLKRELPQAAGMTLAEIQRNAMPLKREASYKKGTP